VPSDGQLGGIRIAIPPYVLLNLNCNYRRVRSFILSGAPKFQPACCKLHSGETLTHEKSKRLRPGLPRDAPRRRVAAKLIGILIARRTGYDTMTHEPQT
jgi:hypothetical protein